MRDGTKNEIIGHCATLRLHVSSFFYISHLSKLGSKCKCVDFFVLPLLASKSLVTSSKLLFFPNFMTVQQRERLFKNK